MADIYYRVMCPQEGELETYLAPEQAVLHCEALNSSVFVHGEGVHWVEIYSPIFPDNYKRAELERKAMLSEQLSTG